MTDEWWQDKHSMMHNVLLEPVYFTTQTKIEN